MYSVVIGYRYIINMYGAVYVLSCLVINYNTKIQGNIKVVMQLFHEYGDFLGNLALIEGG